MHEVRMRGVDVDVCFACNGVVLDKGEIEQLQRPEHKGVMSAILNWFKPETEKPI
jgi:Zn-finger nucleic acid-binding protein